MSNAKKLFDMFAATGLKKPALHLGRMVLKRGTLYSGGQRCDGVWVYGKGGSLCFVNATQETIMFGAGRYAVPLSPQERADTYKTITDICTDLLTLARTYGHASNSCMFCGKGLTDPQSVEHGYGPVCAAHWNLPWGGGKAKAKATIRAAVTAAAAVVEAAATPRVGILVSPGYGAGFSTWGKPEMATDLEIIAAVESAATKQELDDVVTAIVNRKYPGEYTGGVEQLIVEYVAPGTKYRITEYDGYETLETEASTGWAIA